MSIVNPNVETATFGITNLTQTAVLTGADTITDDTPANTVIIADTSVRGTLISSLSAAPRATVALTALHLFVSDDSGTTKRLIGSALMAAHTVATDTAIPITPFLNTDGTLISDAAPFRLGVGQELYVGASVALAGGIVVTSTRVDF